MMAFVKLYGPMLLLLFWAGMFAVAGGIVLAVIAFLSLGAATTIQVDEASRQYRKRRHK